MKIPFYIVDVFTDKKYAGNQLAVFLDANNLTSEQMQKIATEINFAESTFILNHKNNNYAEIRIFTPEYEMQFAGHPIIGTTSILMNKIFDNNPTEITLKVPAGEISVHKNQDLIYLKANQPQFFDCLSKNDFLEFTNLTLENFQEQLPVQEVTTGSAFVIIPLKDKENLKNITINKDKMDVYLKKVCTTEHRSLYFYVQNENEITSRMFYIANNILKEDAATGSASSCLLAYLLKYINPKIIKINNQGEFINRPSQIFLNGKLENNIYNIQIAGKTQFLAEGTWES